MYKVFVNNKLICFDKKLPPLKHSEKYFVCETLKSNVVSKYLRKLKASDDVNTLYILNDYIYNEDNADNRLLPFPIIQAAGGLVQNFKGDYLFIYRFEHWDLPKGLIEHGESTMQAALREVNEETGVNNLKIIDFITITRHIVGKDNRFFIKEIYWYKMKTDFVDATIPQQAESIVKAEWFNKKQIADIILPSTYKTIIEVLNYC